MGLLFRCHVDLQVVWHLPQTEEPKTQMAKRMQSMCCNRICIWWTVYKLILLWSWLIGIVQWFTALTGPVGLGLLTTSGFCSRICLNFRWLCFNVNKKVCLLHCLKIFAEMCFIGWTFNHSDMLLCKWLATFSLSRLAGFNNIQLRWEAPYPSDGTQR